MWRSTYESVRIDRFVFGSTRRSIRLRQSNRTAKVRLRFRRRTFHVPNQMHTLRINYINYIYPRGLCIPSTWHVRKGRHSEQDGGKRGMCLFFLFRNNWIYLPEMRKIKKKRIYSWSAHTLQTDRNFPIQAISKAKRKDFSEQNLQKQQLKKTLLYSNRDYATEVTSITL